MILREAQPVSGGKSPQNSGASELVALTEAQQAKGETPPQKRGEVLPKDKRALETASSDSSTESAEEGEVLASSSTTPLAA